MRLFYMFFVAFAVNVTAQAQITFQLSSTSVSCFGGNNGVAHASAMGGTAPYNYQWSNGVASSSIFNLTAGVYTVTATDQIGATASKSITILQPPPIGLSLNGQPQLCDLAPDGFVYAVPTGGTPPYTYIWSNGATTQLNNHLAAGIYTVTITDIRGCTASKTHSLSDMAIGLFLFTNTENADCPTAANGTAVATVASGTAPYSYLWDNGSTSDTLSALRPGVYVVTVTDVNGCSATGSASIGLSQPDPIQVPVDEVQCVESAYQFEAQPAYQQFFWTTNHPQDTIIQGQDNRQATVIWRMPGNKLLSVEMLDTTLGCIATLQFSVQVEICLVENQNIEGELDPVLGPNPFHAQVVLDHAQANSILEAWNLQGVKYFCASVDTERMALNLGHLPSGIYFFQWRTPTLQKSWRMVKE